MRYAFVATLTLAAFALGGCGCNYPTSFWWNTRLVPANEQAPTVSGTGATDYAPVAVAPVHEVH
jgi:hypothetical protein